jgi:hypothetical protein
MELQFVIENRIRRERLPRPVREMVDEDFNHIVKKEKWNIVAALSKLSFWDERRPVLCRKCNPKSSTSKTFIDGEIIDIINKSVIPYY